MPKNRLAATVTDANSGPGGLAASHAETGGQSSPAESKQNPQDGLEAQARLAAIINSCDDAIVSKTLDGVIDSWNPAAERVFGYTADEAIGKSMRALIPPERAEEETLILAQIARGENVKHFETVRVRKDGQPIHIAVTISPIIDRAGRVIGASKIARDITERKRIERRIEWLASFPECNPNPIVELDLEQGVLHYTNPAALRQFPDLHQWGLQHPLLQGLKAAITPMTAGEREVVQREIVVGGSCYSQTIHFIPTSQRFRIYSTNITESQQAEALRLAVTGAEIGTWHWDVATGELLLSDRCKFILGIPLETRMTFPRFLESLHPDDRDRVDQAIKAALETHRDYEIEFRSRWPDGSQHWAVSKGRGYYDAMGQLLRVEGVTLDINKRKQTENEIQSLNAALQVQATRLAEANQELESFSYSVSHDLRAPLRHINGFVDLVHKHASEALDDKSRRYLRIVAETATEMGQLIDGLLDFSHIGRVEMRRMPVPLGPIVEDALANLASEVEGRHIIWTCGALPEVAGDPGLLKQVFVNLLSNAVKYSRQRDPAVIEIGCEKETGNEVILFVRDNGAGFDLQYADKLFGVFQRLHHADEFEGTGIGLANVRRIILRHGGRIWAHAAVDAGATFFFALPKAPLQ